MGRARNIKPGFFKNEDLAECSPWARLCFAGLWTLADRDGRLEDRPRRIKGELFAYDSIEVEPLLQELVEHGFIERYERGGIKVIRVLEFVKHQTPHYSERPSDLPPPAASIDDMEPKPTCKPLASAPLTHDEAATPENSGVDAPSCDHDSWRTPENSGELRSTGLMKRGSQPPDSLIPDSLIPDSPNPDSSSLRSELAARGSASLHPAPLVATDLACARSPPHPGTLSPRQAERKRPLRRALPPATTAAVWAAYSTTYVQQHGAYPVRNAKINGQLAQFIGRLGAAEAPEVARFYVRHERRDYVQSMHSVDLMLKHAESLRTQWATGRKVMSKDASEADRIASDGAMWARVAQQLRARGIT